MKSEQEYQKIVENSKNTEMKSVSNAVFLIIFRTSNSAIVKYIKFDPDPKYMFFNINMMNEELDKLIRNNYFDNDVEMKEVFLKHMIEGEIQQEFDSVEFSRHINKLRESIKKKLFPYTQKIVVE